MVTNSTNIGYDLLVVKYNTQGELTMAKHGGGESFDKAISSAISPSGDIYITGYGYNTTTFDTVVTNFDGFYPFLVKLNMDDVATGLQVNASSENI